MQQAPTMETIFSYREDDMSYVPMRDPSDEYRKAQSRIARFMAIGLGIYVVILILVSLKII